MKRQVNNRKSAAVKEGRGFAPEEIAAEGELLDVFERPIRTRRLKKEYGR